MTKDLYYVNVAHLSEFTPEIQSRGVDAIHPVGLSHLGEYLEMMFGPEVPENPDDMRRSKQLLGALTVLSTAHNIPEILEAEPTKLMPHWLSVVIPVIDASKALGRQVDLRMGEAERIKEPPRVSNDLTYITGLFDLSSFIVSLQLDLPHPRLNNSDLVDRSKGVVFDDQEFMNVPKEGENSTIELLLTMPFVRSEEKRKLRQLLIRGQRIIGQTEINLARMQELLARDQSD